MNLSIRFNSLSHNRQKIQPKSELRAPVIERRVGGRGFQAWSDPEAHDVVGALAWFLCGSLLPVLLMVPAGSG